MRTKIIISLLFISFFAGAQEFISTNLGNFLKNKEGEKEARMNLKEADMYYLQGMKSSYILATSFYKKCLDYNPLDASINYKLGVSFVMSMQSMKGLPYLLKANELDKNVAPDLLYLLGRCYHQSYQFQKAKDYYTQFKRVASKDNNEMMVEKTKRRIKECEVGIELMKTPARVIIENVGKNVNTEFADYGPIISADASVLIYTSRRSSTTGGGMSLNDNEFFEDIYFSQDSSKSWSYSKNNQEQLNTKVDESAIGLSPDGQLLFVFKGRNGGDIYTSKLEGDQWSKPTALNNNINTPYSENSASLSYDGNILYYSSDRKEASVGGYDIYMSHKQPDGSWGPSENLGAPVNTPENEMGVFMMPDDRTLYFCSNGHKTMGGFDILRSYLQDNGKWSKPENIGFAINTPEDDIFFVLSANGKQAYYSSVREDSYGYNDIYKISFLNPKRQILQTNEDKLIAANENVEKETVLDTTYKLKTIRLTIVKGQVTDANTKATLEATIEIVDNQKNQVIYNASSNSKTGKYLVSLPSGKNYGLVVKKDGYIFHSENFDLHQTSSYQEVLKDIALQPVDVGSKVVLNNIFFDFGIATLKSESTPELERIISFMKDYPTLKIEVSGHTDNVGADAFNQKLSESRAKAVIDYLISKGVDATRLEYKGYGMQKPVAPNDTEEGRAQNRRVEFKILSK